MANSKIMNLKLLIDSSRNKVVFAEAGKDFVDFLLNLLALPVGSVIRHVNKSAVIGSMGNVYDSLEKLNESYLLKNPNKDSNLKRTIETQVTDPNLLLPDTNKKPENLKLYYCTSHPGFVSDISNSICSRCRSQGCTRYMSQEVQFVGRNAEPSGEGGYVKGLVTYMVTDDLSVSPMSILSGVALLNSCGFKDFGSLKEKQVEFGIHECLELLKASLSSKEALTDVFCAKQKGRVGAASNKKRRKMHY